MPIYEYRCADCHQVFEEWQKTFEEKPLTCPVCGGTAARMVSNTTFMLKGGGWYVTEYGNRKQKGDDGQEKSGHSPSSMPASTAAADAKTTPPTAPAPPAPAAAHA